MAKILVHIHTGPDDPTKAALGLLVGLTGHREGHDVSFFIAGDGVHLLAEAHRGATGTGTGNVGEHLDALKAAGVRMLLSGMSAKARGYDERLLDGFDAAFSMPDGLIRLAIEADTVLCY